MEAETSRARCEGVCLSAFSGLFIGLKYILTDHGWQVPLEPALHKYSVEYSRCELHVFDPNRLRIFRVFFPISNAVPWS